MQMWDLKKMAKMSVLSARFWYSVNSMALVHNDLIPTAEELLEVDLKKIDDPGSSIFIGKEASTRL